MSWIQEEVDYTLSVLNKLEKINEGFEKMFETGDPNNLNLFNLSQWHADHFIDWDRLIFEVLPTHLKYLHGSQTSDYYHTKERVKNGGKLYNY